MNAGSAQQALRAAWSRFITVLCAAVGIGAGALVGLNWPENPAAEFYRTELIRLASALSAQAAAIDTQVDAANPVPVDAPRSTPRSARDDADLPATGASPATAPSWGERPQAVGTARLTAATQQLAEHIARARRGNSPQPHVPSRP